MRLVSLTVQYVRAHSEYSLDIAPNITFIAGRNGSGKTSLLEAIYIALQGSSFKGSDSEILQNEAPWYRIDIKSQDNVARTVKYDPSRSSGKKQFEIDGKTLYRLPYAYKYPVILFEPDDMRLISGSPSRRRQFIDRFIGQIDPEYSLSLRRYERALMQRNSYLKKKIRADDLFVWDMSLSKYGAYVVESRIKLLRVLQPLLKGVYKDISDSDDMIGISYSDTYSESIEERLLHELYRSVERDIHLGYTSVGPHRHDVLFTLNDVPAASNASRGEIRTIVLALKFLEVAILKESTGKDPIILLDDVFSELDESRQSALMDRFSQYQTIVTGVNSLSKNYPVIQLK